MYPDPSALYQAATYRHHDDIRRAARSRLARLFRKPEPDPQPPTPQTTPRTRYA